MPPRKRAASTAAEGTKKKQRASRSTTRNTTTNKATISEATKAAAATIADAPAFSTRRAKSRADSMASAASNAPSAVSTASAPAALTATAAPVFSSPIAEPALPVIDESQVTNGVTISRRSSVHSAAVSEMDGVTSLANESEVTTNDNTNEPANLSTRRASASMEPTPSSHATAPSTAAVSVADFGSATATTPATVTNTATTSPKRKATETESAVAEPRHASKRRKLTRDERLHLDARNKELARAYRALAKAHKGSLRELGERSHQTVARDWFERSQLDEIRGVVAGLEGKRKEASQRVAAEWELRKSQLEREMKAEIEAVRARYGARAARMQDEHLHGALGDFVSLVEDEEMGSGGKDHNEEAPESTGEQVQETLEVAAILTGLKKNPALRNHTITPTVRTAFDPRGFASSAIDTATLARAVERGRLYGIDLLRRGPRPVASGQASSATPTTTATKTKTTPTTTKASSPTSSVPSGFRAAVQAALKQNELETDTSTTTPPTATSTPAPPQPPTRRIDIASMLNPVDIEPTPTPTAPILAPTTQPTIITTTTSTLDPTDVPESPLSDTEASTFTPRPRQPLGVGTLEDFLRLVAAAKEQGAVECREAETLNLLATAALQRARMPPPVLPVRPW